MTPIALDIWMFLNNGTQKCDATPSQNTGDRNDTENFNFCIV